MNYEKIKYPDGQISIKIKNFHPLIEMRINSYEDLFVLKSVVEAAGRDRPRYLKIPCMFGQRSDRRFDRLQSFDLKIICEFINSMKFEDVKIFDPHSDVSLALINNSIKETSFNYVSESIDNIEGKNDNFISLVSPDAGAYKKVFEYGEKLNLPVVAANKHRDLNGEIQLKFVGDVKDKECLIVDDICDGGYTFYLLAKALREQGASKVYLYVSHMYASKGFTARLKEDDPDSSLVRFLDGVYCTNSVKDISNEYFDGWKMRSLHNFITQYKII